MRRQIAPQAFLAESVAVGAVMDAGAIGRVTASEHAGFAVGDHVYGGFGVQEFARSDGTGVTKLDPSLAPLTAYLGAVGIPGLTAYFGMFDVGRAGAGDTVVVSGAAGGVGSVAGQIARIRGCRVIGIAGGPEKCRWLLDELGFDAAIDYKAEDVARCAGGARTRRRRCLLRQRRRRDPRRSAHPPRSRGARRPQRRSLAVQRATRAADLPTTCSSCGRARR